MPRRAALLFVGLLFVALLAGGGGPAAAAPEPLEAPLLPGDLTDPDLLPPDLLVPLDRLAASGLAPAPAAAVVRKTGLLLDWDGDGRSETSIRSGGSGLVRTSKGERRVTLTVVERGGAWWVGPAMVLATKAGAPLGAMLLDADLDGRYDGEADRVRFGDGAFMRLAEPRRAQHGLDLLRWRLVRDGERVTLQAEVEAPPAGAGAAEVAGLAAVNAFRSRAGLAPLTLDLAWCAGCRKHAEYIVLNPGDGFGHSETPGRPGYSQEGLTAAVEGVMERSGDPAVAVESLTAMMMHRTPFLADPTARVGVGIASAFATRPDRLDPQLPGYCVLRAGVALASHAWPVVVPGPGQKGVPLLANDEVPEPDRYADVYARPRGYPVSVSFLGVAQRPVRLALRTAKGQSVEAYGFTPAEPIHASFAHNYATAFLLPKEPLEATTVYEAEAVAGEGAVAQRLIWRFTTGR